MRQCDISCIVVHLNLNLILENGQKKVKKKKHKQKTKYTIQLSSHKAFWSFYHKITVLIKSISQSIPRRAL